MISIRLVTKVVTSFVQECEEEERRQWQLLSCYGQLNTWLHSYQETG